MADNVVLKADRRTQVGKQAVKHLRPSPQNQRLGEVGKIPDFPRTFPDFPRLPRNNKNSCELNISHAVTLQAGSADK